MISVFHKSNSKDSLQLANDFTDNLCLNYETISIKPNSSRFRKKDLDPLRDSDLNDYLDNMQYYRSTNSLILRRPKVSIKLHSKSVSDSRFVVHPLEVDQFIGVMNGNDSNAIIQMSDTITKLCESTPSAMSNIIESDEAIQCYINALQTSESEDVIISLLTSLSSLFPFCSKRMDDIVDLLYLEFSQLLESATPSTILPSINLIISISRYSSYGRSSLISAGIHELLINIAMTADNQDISINCCIALEFIFSEVENLDFDTLIQNNVMSITQLFSLPYVEAKTAILSTFNSLITQVPKASNRLCQLSHIHITLLNSLDDEDLQEPSVQLISNLCQTADISYVKEMIENNLIPILIELINSDKAAISLHTISLLIDRLHEEVYCLLPEEFNENIIEIANMSPFEIKKQASYLIATEIYTLNPAKIENLMNPQAIQLLVDMLSSGQTDITLQCLNALGSIAQTAVMMGKEKEFAEYLNDSEIISVLESLGDDRLITISDRARSLIKKLEPILFNDSTK